jgi:hypothetical protein
MADVKSVGHVDHLPSPSRKLMGSSSTPDSRRRFWNLHGPNQEAFPFPIVYRG